MAREGGSRFRTKNPPLETVELSLTFVAAEQAIIGSDVDCSFQFVVVLVVSCHALFCVNEESIRTRLHRWMPWL